MADINKILLAVVRGDPEKNPEITIMKQFLELPMGRPDIANRYETLGTFGGFSLGNMGISLYGKPKNDDKHRIFTMLYNKMPISAWNTLRNGDGLLTWIHMTAEGNINLAKQKAP